MKGQILSYKIFFVEFAFKIARARCQAFFFDFKAIFVTEKHDFFIKTTDKGLSPT